MKNHINTKRHWMVPLAVVLIGFGCKKEPTDYRSKYLGKWDFQVNKGKYIYMEGGKDSSLTYTGRIGPVDADGLNIRYTSEDSIVLKIDEAGKLSGYPTAYCFGEFTDFEKLHLHLQWGGLGGKVWHEMDAVKK